MFATVNYNIEGSVTSHLQVQSNSSLSKVISFSTLYAILNKFYYTAFYICKLKKKQLDEFD